MAETRTKNIARSTASGLIFRVVSMLLPFLLRTIIIQKLGNEYLGLSSLFTSILQVLSLSELGFSTAISYSMYKPIAENDKPKVCALLSLIRKVYRIIGLVILVVGLGLMPFLPNLISGDYPADINLYILYLIYLFNTVVSYFMFSYTSSLLSAHQRNDVENIISLVSNIFMYVSQIIVLFVFKNYYIYIIFLPISTLLINLFRYFRVKKLFPDYVCEGKVDKEEAKVIYKNIGALAGHKLSGVIISSVCNIIISAYLGLELLGIYSNYYYILTALMQIILIVYVALTPSIGNCIVVDSVEKNYRDFKTLTFCNVWMMGWMSISLLCLYQPFIELWLGSEFLLPNSTMVLFVLYFYLWRFKDILSTYKDSAGMWKDDFWKPYVVTVVSLILNLVLVKFIGINGSLIAGIAGFFVVSMPWETHVFFKKYFKMKEGPYYLRMLIYTLVISVLAVGTYYICSLITLTGILGLLIKGMICAVVPNIFIILLSFKTPEFKRLWGKVMSILKRKQN